MKRLLLASTMILGIGSAQAVTTLTLENPGQSVYQQTLNNPCVIGDPSCNNPAGFGETIIPSGPQAQYDLTSPNYLVSQIIAALSGHNTFAVGIDVNTTTQPLATEKLDLFTMSVNGVVVAIYDPASPGTQLFTVNNGNGFSDEVLRGFSLAGFLPGDTVNFRAVVNDATDGREQIFLVDPSSPKIPEPMSIALLGMGLLGLGTLRRRNA